MIYYIEYFGSAASDFTLMNQQQIKTLIRSEMAAPARLAWQYRADLGAFDGPADGCFHEGNDKLRFSFKTHNGATLNKGTPENVGEWSPHNDDQYILTIWKKVSDGNWKFMTNMECNKFKWNTSVDGSVAHFYFVKRWSSHEISSLVDNTVYYITAGGFF